MEKRVLIVGMSPETGGVETFLYSAISRLHGNGIRFDVLATCPRCAFESELKRMRVRVFHVARRGENPLRSYLDKRRFFQKRGRIYDVIWLHPGSASDLSVFNLAKKYARAKLVCHTHSVSFESKGGAVRAAHMLLHRFHQKKLAELCDVCVAVSRAAGEWLFGPIGKRLIVLPNGVDTGKYRLDEGLRRAARQSLGVEGKTVVGHVGRLVPVKNQKFLIDAFAAFHEKRSASVLLIAGAGELMEELKAYAAQKGLLEEIRFLGFREDIPALLQAFDVFLLPSLFEGFPVVLSEAQACALPCVVSDAVTKEVAVTQFIRFCPLKSAEVWAAETENALMLRRDATGARLALTRAGLTAEAAAERLKAVLLGE